MSTINDRRFLERLEFFNGQRLFATDLQELESLHRELRWLHNQSLHQAGVGRGYIIEAVKGDREVKIGPGYAVDLMGREIILTRDQIEPVPPVAGDGSGGPAFYDLTVSYPTDEELEESETRQGICLPRGVVRRLERPSFCWIRLAADAQGNLSPRDTRLAQDVEKGLRLVLARVEVLNCALDSDPSTSERRLARPSEAPHLACGSTSPSSTEWRVWQEEEGAPLGLQLDLDTTSGRFRTIPCYTASVLGERLFRAEGSDDDNGLPPLFLLEGFVQVDNSTVNGFRLRLLMPPLVRGFNPSRVLEQDEADLRRMLAGNHWYVNWIGIES